MPSSTLTRAIALAATLVFGLGAAGCGSSKSKSTKTTSTPAITKAAFLKKGNAICRRGNQQISKAAKKLSPKGSRPTKAQVTKFAAGTLLPTVQSDVKQLKALGAPAGDEAKVNAILSSAQAAVDKAKKDPLLLASNGPGPFRNTNKLTKAYGLKVCGGS
jgi:hypothetical protein